MANTLAKTRKQIAKKRGTNNLVLHEKSRNTLRLHKAHVRDQRLQKLATARGKKEQPIGTSYCDCVQTDESGDRDV